MTLFVLEIRFGQYSCEGKILLLLGAYHLSLIPPPYSVALFVVSLAQSQVLFAQTFISFPPSSVVCYLHLCPLIPLSFHICSSFLPAKSCLDVSFFTGSM